ncbi:thioredoxin domain-containing protein [Arcticibacter sp. MXS-1]|uniref:thioredoxin domain-containing protein n=1 Tax=Arcticibacter sp. MXS-1 TaxID=3341726 RepID=UPI0035A92DED
MPNRLSKETSPYLLQHANNPVEWYPWGSEALTRAREENKLILVSVGYSACHWCHVMEHESFEDESVAAIMNEHFVCIKVDREERPDIDQVYMLAVQLMTGQGGWPLNCICLPDQRPIYGGTYFRRDDWKNLLMQLAHFWQNKPQEAEEYASRLTEGIQQTEKLNLSEERVDYSKSDLEDIFRPWSRTFDLQQGGYNRAPKFPLPNNWSFMLRYAYYLNAEQARAATDVTLKKMAYGGIYDHIGGGFARYSVDGRWHVPHFEKMLYDNAQLVSLYTEAWQSRKEKLYERAVFETLEWVRREMTSPEGGFYSALDADSEGVEGKFYTFTQEELNQLLPEEERMVFCAFFNVTESGNWPEERTNVLIRIDDDARVALQLGLTEERFSELLSSAKRRVFEYREARVRPGLDNKILAAWNGMMLKGLADAYRAFGEKSFLDAALKNAAFIREKLIGESGAMSRVYKNGQSASLIDTAFLDDYAFVAEAFISLYEATFNEDWLLEARKLTDYVLDNFYDAGTGMFYYTSRNDQELIARKHEITDNVIPSSNSVMAHNLFRLGHFFGDEQYLAQADVMLANVFPLIKTYGSGYSNWAMLLMYKIFGLYEVAITGPEAQQKRAELEKFFIPAKIILGGSAGSLPLLEDKWDKVTKIFVCKNRTCRLPVTEVPEALKQIDNQ